MAKVLSILAVIIGVFLIVVALHGAYAELAASPPSTASHSAGHP